MPNLSGVRPWWHDLLIQTAGGAAGAIIAALFLAVAAKVSFVFDDSRRFSLPRFLETLLGLLGAVLSLVTVIAYIAGWPD